MDILVVAGMLGAGKTSIIIQLLDPLSAGGRKVAIIENEIGSVGIDGEVLNKGGLQIRELAGGCVCCTLKTGMIDTLKALQAELDPDIVVIEPTGIADPEYILISVDGVMGLDVGSSKVIVVIDAERFLKLKTMFERPLKNQLETADIVLINKVDTIPPQDLKAVEDSIRSAFKYEGKIVHVRGDTGEGIASVPKEIGL